MRASLRLLLVASVLLPAGGVAQEGAFTPERRARVLADGRPLYLRYCATCHGAEGDGRGVSAKWIGHPARNFRTGNYEFRMTPLGTLAREEDIFRTISLGVLGTPMPAWRETLSYEQRRLLAQYLMALSPRYLKEKPGRPIEIPRATLFNAESVGRGKALFEQLGCVPCHGAQGRGDGPLAEHLVDESGERIRPYDLTKGYFQGGKGGEVIFRAISTGLSGTPMPSFEALEPGQRWDLVHFVQSLAEPRGPLDYLFDDPAGRNQVP